jgi:hypothetical protein
VEILGVLLGITMSAVGFGAWWLKREYRYSRSLADQIMSQMERISALEHRKAFQPVATSEAAPQTTATAPKLRYRTWNEDAVMPEKSN